MLYFLLLAMKNENVGITFMHATTVFELLKSMRSLFALLFITIILHDVIVRIASWAQYYDVV